VTDSIVHVHTNDRVCIVLAGNSMRLVGDCDVESPVVVFVNNFSGTNAPLSTGERGP
jgi:hypothetical protein